MKEKKKKKDTPGGRDEGGEGIGRRLGGESMKGR